MVFDSTEFEPLYREVMGRCLAIREALQKHDRLLNETSLEERRALRLRFWNEYVYPKFEEVYFEMFPEERATAHNQDKFRASFKLREYNQKMAIALCAWLQREGFFHFFEGEVLFVNPDPTDLASASKRPGSGGSLEHYYRLLRCRSLESTQ